MEVTLLDKFNYQQNGPIHDNKFPCSQRRSAKIHDKNYEREVGCCQHFTIRGYVADLRKKDVKFGWPFGTPNHQVSDKEVKSLPPLGVSHFRRWNCKDCLHKTISANLNVTVDVNVESNNASFRGVDSVTSHELGLNDHPDGTSTLPRSPKRTSEYEAEETTQGSPLCEGIDNNSGDNIHPDGHQFIENKEKELCLVDEIRKEDAVIVASLVNHEGSTHENVSADQEVIDSVQKVSNEISQEISVYESNNTNNAVVSRTDTVNETHNISIDQNEILLVEFQNDDQQANGTDNTSDRLHLGSKHKASSFDDSCENQDYSNRVDPSNKRRKKLPRMKFLVDIMRNEEFGKPPEIYMSNIDAKHVRPGTSKCGEPDVSGGEATCSQEFVYPLCSQRTNIVSTEKGKGDKCSENDDGRFLKNWGKKLSRKSTTGQEEAKMKGIDNTACNISADNSGIPQEKLIDLNSEYCGNLSEVVTDLNSNNSKVYEGVCRIPQEDNIAVNDHTRHETAPCKQLNFKSKGLGRTGRIQCHCITEKKATKLKHVSSKNKDKALIVEKERPLRKHLQKDTSCAIGASNAVDLKMNGERRMNPEVDDLSMDIVELLARNLHERRLMDASAATGTSNEIEEIKESVESRDHDISGASKVDQVNSSMDMDQPVSQKFHQIGNIRSISSTVSGASRYTKCDGKQHHAPANASINKQSLVDPSTRSSALSGFHNYSQPRIYNPSRSTCVDINERKVPASCEDGKGNWGQNSQGVQGIISETPNGRSSWSSNSTDINFRDPLLTRCLVGLPSTNYVQRPLDSIRRDAEYQAKFSMQSGNSEADMYNNDMTAMQLLWMFDPTAYSDKLRYRTMDTDHLNHSEFYYPKGSLPSFSRSEFGTTGTVAGLCERGSSSCSKPLRPLPRLGVLGTDLQREIASHSDKCRTPFGSMSKISNDLTRPIIGGMTPIESTHIGRNSGPTTLLGVGSIQESSKIKASGADMIMNSQYPMTNNSETELQSAERVCKIELCAINRNPADFAIVGDDCEYMIGCEQPRHKSVMPRVNAKKRQKVMKLIDL